MDKGFLVQKGGKHLLRRIYAFRHIYLLMLPAFLYIAIFHYGPMYGAQIAFKDFRASLGIWGSKWVGMKHFIRFFQYPDFWRIIGNTMGLSLYGIIVGFPMPIVLALFLNEVENQRFKKTVQMITYAPHFLSVVVGCGLILIFFSQSSGIVNHLIEALGGKRIGFLTEPIWFKTLYVFTGIWKNTGWNAIIYLAAITSIDPSLYEAAAIDGAGRWNKIKYVTLPGIKPTIVILLLMNVGNVLNAGFEIQYLLGNGLIQKFSQTIDIYVLKWGISQGDYAIGTAAGIFKSLVSIILIVLANQFAKHNGEEQLF